MLAGHALVKTVALAAVEPPGKLLKLLTPSPKLDGFDLPASMRSKGISPTAN
jgi:hypothetical protein